MPGVEKIPGSDGISKHLFQVFQACFFVGHPVVDKKGKSIEVAASDGGVVACFQQLQGIFPQPVDAVVGPEHEGSHLCIAAHGYGGIF